MFSGCPSLCACVRKYACVSVRTGKEAFTDRLAVDFYNVSQKRPPFIF